jgi:sporulation protein YlmC with PRC-barrel domain
MNNFLLLLTLVAFLIWIPAGLTEAAAETAGVWGKTYKVSALTKAEVKNLKGERLGEIEDFVMDGQSGRIALVIFSHQGIAGLGRKVKIIPYALLVFNETEKNFTLDVGIEDLIPALGVRNFQGEALGEIEDLVMDSWGRIPFAILSHKEKLILIPITALIMDRTGKFFILDASEEKLAAAPPYAEDSVIESRAEEIYRHFGQHPYWQEDEEEPPPNLHQLVPLPEF